MFLCWASRRKVGAMCETIAVERFASLLKGHRPPPHCSALGKKEVIERSCFRASGAALNNASRILSGPGAVPF
eukprot:2561430-Pyramimonas_sp.AAC.1